MDFEYPDEPPETGYHIIRKWVDGTGVNIRWMDKYGDVHESNMAQELDENDKWKDRMDKKVADLYAQKELAEEKISESSSEEMDMQVNKISDSNWQNQDVDIEDKVEKRKKRLKKKREQKKKQKKELETGERQEKRSKATPTGAESS